MSKETLVKGKNGKWRWVKKKKVASTSQTTLPQISMAYSDSRPLVSQGMGCHRNQVEKFNKSLEHRGMINSCHYNEEGNFVTTSRHARNEELKFRGMRDGDAGYGDHAGYN